MRRHKTPSSCTDRHNNVPFQIELIETLQKLRVHGRKPENADPIYEKEVRKQMVLGAHVTALTDYL